MVKLQYRSNFLSALNPIELEHSYQWWAANLKQAHFSVADPKLKQSSIFPSFLTAYQLIKIYIHEYLINY